MAMRWIALVAVVALAVTAAATSGCRRDCVGACECTGNSCICPDNEDCEVICTDACDLQCAGPGLCDFVCDNLCQVSCTGSGTCLADVGPDSMVDCPGSSGCDVICTGDCEVRCPGSGTCTVFCDPGFECDVMGCSGSRQTCPDDVLVCQGSCP